MIVSRSTATGFGFAGRSVMPEGYLCWGLRFRISRTTLALRPQMGGLLSPAFVAAQACAALTPPEPSGATLPHAELEPKFLFKSLILFSHSELNLSRLSREGSGGSGENLHARPAESVASAGRRQFAVIHCALQHYRRIPGICKMLTRTARLLVRGRAEVNAQVAQSDLRYPAPADPTVQLRAHGGLSLPMAESGSATTQAFRSLADAPHCRGRHSHS